MDGPESAAAEGATFDVVVRLVRAVVFATLVRSAAPVLGAAVCFGVVARPVLPTLAPVLLCAVDIESPPAESA
ncbi:hypothetical protein CIW47_23240 [Mycolicibacterium sp. P1-5]|nr:hypothetical protein CIW47_23240 [Mycolicibacterium sp. P1-5]